MYDFIFQLKGIVTVILISEFLKELLITKRFHNYIHFAVSLILFSFFLGFIGGTDVTIPEIPDYAVPESNENLLKSEYEIKISEAVQKKLSDSGISADVSVELDNRYEITNITVYTAAPPESVKALLEGDAPYEVVFRPENP